MNKIVDTLGWDTVFAASYNTVNEAIESKHTYPTNFNYVEDGTGIIINGTWKSWKLTPGGSGGSVKMECIVESGIVEGLNQPIGDLSSSSLIIRVRLKSLKSDKDTFKDPTAKVGTGEANILMINTESTAANLAVVVSQDSKYPNIKSELFQNSLDGIFAKYFNEHISEFNHVFSIMMLNEEADNGDFAWLKPTTFSYAVGGPKDGTIDEHVFGVLSMTGGENISLKQQQSIDISCLQNLPKGSNSAFVISAERVVEHMLLSGAVATIQGSKKEDFEISADGISISNVKDMIWNKFEIDKGNVIEPTLDKGSFTMSMQSDHISLEIVGAHYEVSHGITVKMNLTQKFTYQTIKCDNGNYVFIPDTSKFTDAKINSTVEVAEWIDITKIITTTVSIIAYIICGLGSIAEACAEKAVITKKRVRAASVIMDLSELFSEESEINSINGISAISIDESFNAVNRVVQKGGILANTKLRNAIGIIAALAALPAITIDIATMIINKDYENIPPFNNFASNCLGVMKWPGMKDAELISADIRQSLVIATKLVNK